MYFDFIILFIVPKTCWKYFLSDKLIILNSLSVGLDPGREAGDASVDGRARGHALSGDADQSARVEDTSSEHTVALAVAVLVGPAGANHVRGDGLDSRVTGVAVALANRLHLRVGDLAVVVAALKEINEILEQSFETKYIKGSGYVN